LAIINWDVISTKFIHNSYLTDPELYHTYQRHLDQLSNVAAINKFVIALFWSGLGLVAYTLVWGVSNVVIEARNEVVLETEYTNKGSLWRRLVVPMAQAGLALVLLGLLLAEAKWIFPMWISLF